MQVGLYIHIPFCASKCFYCDFLSFPKKEAQEESLKEDVVVKSIFIGGGTPTVLPPLLLDKILRAVLTYFKIEPYAEWTIEANPGTLDREKIQVLSNYPITRVSLGVQSTHDHLLRHMGRTHTFHDFHKSLQMIRQSTNWQVNADLMFAIPHQTEEDFRKTLETMTDYQLEHLSIYALIIEEGTRFGELYNSGNLETISDEMDRRMYHWARQYLASKGYHQYEISNWAKPECECRHNKLYWQTEPYLGLGLGAHSLFEHRRYYNENNMKSYIKAQGDLTLLRYEEEVLTQKMEMQEYMFLGLRLVEGIAISDFKERFKVDLWQVYGQVLDKWIEYKVLAQNKERVYLTPYGMDVCNEVFASFL